MDYIKNVIRGQQAVMKTGEIVTTLEQSRVEGNVIVVRASGKKDSVTVGNIDKLLPCPIYTERKRVKPDRVTANLIEPNPARGW